MSTGTEAARLSGVSMFLVVMGRLLKAVNHLLKELPQWEDASQPLTPLYALELEAMDPVAPVSGLRNPVKGPLAVVRHRYSGADKPGTTSAKRVPSAHELAPPNRSAVHLFRAQVSARMATLIREVEYFINACQKEKEKPSKAALCTAQKNAGRAWDSLSGLDANFKPSLEATAAGREYCKAMRELQQLLQALLRVAEGSEYGTLLSEEKLAALHNYKLTPRPPAPVVQPSA